MDSFHSTSDAVIAVSEHLHRLYRPYAGAQFRCAFLRDGSVTHFLTGHLIFSEEHLVSRDAADYGRLIFAETWCADQWHAVGLLSKLLSGQAEIGGQRIDITFGRSEFYHNTFPTGPHLRTGWQLRSARDRGANWREISISQGRLTGRGLNPYLGPDHAINDWIFDLESYNPVGADVPNRHTIVTTLPDSRARVLRAEWQPPKLRLEVERNVPPTDLEMQVLPVDSRAKFQTVPLDAPEIEITVPEDARSLSIFLLDSAGDCISEIDLNENRRTFGKDDLGLGRQIRGVEAADEIDFGVDADLLDYDNRAIFETKSGSAERRFMEMAIEEARKSKAEDNIPRPKVGAVVVKDGQVLAKAHRGEFPGCHAEFIALEKKLADHKLSGATVYTTLEPCTSRNTPKIACATRLIERRVARVVIGTLDPNPVIRGLGQRSLTNARIEIGVFDADLVQEIEELNREFTRQYEGYAQSAMSVEDKTKPEAAIATSTTPALKTRAKRAWQEISPEHLWPALAHIRKTFDTSERKCSWITENLGYSALHPSEIDPAVLVPYEQSFMDYRIIIGPLAQREFDRLLSTQTPPSVFTAYFNAFQKGLEIEVARLFTETLQIGLANARSLKTPPVEWAKKHLDMLITKNQHRVKSWIKSVCDKRDYTKAPTLEEFKDFVSWSDWRAPKLIYMQPSGNLAYNAETAWSREDESVTQRLLEGLSERFIQSLGFKLDNVAGDAEVNLAKNR